MDKFLKRLYRLRDVVVPAIPRKEFDMATWEGKLYDQKGNVCGTTRCIGGWAAVDPVFRRAGLHMTSGYGDRYVAYNGSPSGVPSLVDFFGIYDNEGADLFYGFAFDHGDNMKPSKRAIKAAITKIIKRMEA